MVECVPGLQLTCDSSRMSSGLEYRCLTAPSTSSQPPRPLPGNATTEAHLFFSRQALTNCAPTCLSAPATNPRTTLWADKFSDATCSCEELQCSYLHREMLRAKLPWRSGATYPSRCSAPQLCEVQLLGHAQRERHVHPMLARACVAKVPATRPRVRSKTN